jgi:hypothetical protein
LELSIDNKSLIQYLIDELGLPQSEAEARQDLNDASLGQYYAGTIELKENKTYEAYMGGDISDGTWSMSSDGKTLLMNESTSDEQLVNIVSLTSSSMHVNMTQSESDDFNEDGIDEEMIIEVDMLLNK